MQVTSSRVELPARAAVEEFLYYEAALIDGWRLRDWVGCFDPEGCYVVPALDCEPDAAMQVDPYSVLCLIADDIVLVQARVERLENIRSHAEHPRSRVRHLVTNVRISWEGSDRVTAHSNLAIYRCRREKTDVYPGQCRHLLRWTGASSTADAFRILERRVVLDLESLDPVGPLSFIA